MNPLALAGRDVLAVMGAVALVTVALYLLRPPSRRATVGSLLVWARLRVARKRSRYGLRWLLSLLLALVTGAVLALALARPEIRSIGWAESHTVLVVDDSPSMATRTADGGTRLAHAVTRARQIVSRSGNASRIMVLDTMGWVGVPEYLAPTEALAALDRLRPVMRGPARLPAVPVSASRPPAYVLLTDGVAALRTPPGWALENVYEPAENAAVTAFEVRASERDPSHYDAFVQVRNHGTKSRKVSVRIRDGAGVAVEASWDLDAGERHDAVLDVSRLREGVLEAKATAEGDAFPADDTAFAVVPAHGRRRVLLVTNGNQPLVDALKLLPAVDVSMLPPAGYTGQSADLCVFDRFAPAVPPACAALLFQAPRAAWLPARPGPATKATVTRWIGGDPLAESVPWHNLQLQKATLADLPAEASGTRAVVYAKGAREGALVVAGTSPRRWIDVGFAIADTNLGLSSGFPVFLAEAARWLGTGDEIVRRAPGNVELGRLAGVVTDAAGHAVPTVGSASGPVFAADAPGVFQVREGARRSWVVVNELDPDYGAVNRQPVTGSASATVRSAVRRPLPMQPWMLVLCVAVLLLLVEWATFCRRITE